MTPECRLTDRPAGHGAPARPMIGFGEVRHTRLRPARHAFAYKGYFILLPMRSMQDLSLIHISEPTRPY